MRNNGKFCLNTADYWAAQYRAVDLYHERFDTRRIILNIMYASARSIREQIPASRTPNNGLCANQESTRWGHKRIRFTKLLGAAFWRWSGMAYAAPATSMY